MTHKTALGKGFAELGLSELLSKPPTEPGSTQHIAIDQLTPGRYQPRRHMDQDSLNDLARSIEQQDIIQPIIVRQQADGRYEIIAGERRWQAAKLAQKTKVPVIVRELSDQDAMTLALIENIQREDLNSVEEAVAIKRLLDNYQLTHQQAADILGKSRPKISNTLRLLNLDTAVLKLIEENQLERGHGIALLALNHPEQQRAVAEQLVAKRASVREAEMLVRRLQKKTAQHADQPNTPSIQSPFEKQLSQLKQHLQSKVSIRANPKGRGQLTIQFDSAQQLEKILGKILLVHAD